MSIVDKLFNTWKKEDHDAQVIKLQYRFILFLLCICILAFIGWMTSPSRMTIYVPPDISNGATLKVDEIPSPLIYSFAYEIWQGVNNWPQDGAQDYKSNIHTYRFYLTPSLESELLQDYDELRTSGQIQRQRSVQSITSAAYDSANVKKLSNNTWQIDMRMRLTEYKNGQVVKDIEILYPLKVVRVAVSKQNPYGLELAGFVSEPIRLKTYI